MGLNTTPATWTTSQVVTAANLNLEVRDALTGIQAAWTSYTPTWTSSGVAPAVNNGTLAGAYMRIGKTIHFRISLAMGSTTTYGTGTYSLSLPVAAVSLSQVVNAGLRDLSPFTEYSCTAFMPSTSSLRLVYGATPVAATAPFTFTNGDTIIVTGTYEAA